MVSERKPPTVVKAMLCGRAPLGDEQFAGTLRGWFETTLAGPAGPLWQRLIARPVQPGDATSVTGSSVSDATWSPKRYAGEPGEIWAEYGFIPEGQEETVGVQPFTLAGWADCLDNVGVTTGTAELSVFELQRMAHFVTPGPPGMFVSASVDTGEDGALWYSLYLTSPAEWAGALLPVLRAAAQSGNPTYGEISYAARLQQSAREVALNQDGDAELLSSERSARGYSWLTVIAQDLGERLGGVEALRDSGAFTEVEAMPGGGFWLLATDRMADYGPDQADRVFSALRPVLDLTKPPEAERFYDEPRLLAPKDLGLAS
ncbi:hypothetical protein AB0J72_00035 [Dactylosporangium sp. NPDC049742]|uniref:hypothetical protein n=1 Tax=Dactylosporangium sp. NPDC049742 TaxID=3154737 RepID=UPI00342231DA